MLYFGTALSGVDPDPNAGFRQGMRELGYVEGLNLQLDFRHAEGRPDRMGALAAELVQMKVDVIVAGGPVPLAAARQATSTIPIVVIGGSDPVRAGWAQTLARPGGNVTGMTVTFPELASKQLELLKQAVPDLVRVAILVAPAEIEELRLEAGARDLGLQLITLEVQTSKDFEAAFQAASAARAQGVYAIATNTIVSQRKRVAELALNHRLPSISELTLLANVGFLMGYGADLEALGRRAATYVDKILKGARPGDLPIERPTDLELVVNLKTARAIGMTLPEALMLRVQRVIE